MTTEARVAAPRGLTLTTAAVVEAMRPRQWVKNLLVYAAPVAGGALGHRHVLGEGFTALLIFTMASAGGYLLNDVFDLQRDQEHPDKRLRPIASGAVSPVVAVVVGLLLVVTAPVLALADHEPGLATVVAVYSLVSVLYSVGLKRVPVFELVVLSSGFVLRPVAGALATNVPPSTWFLGVCCLAAVTIAIGKRQVELMRLGADAASHRRVLSGYSVTGLRRMRVASLVLTLGAYLGWALTRATVADRVLGLLSLVAVAVAMMRLARLNDSGQGDAPETVLLRDRVVQGAVLVWLAVFVLGIARV